ncbi:MAG: hypothetical protein HC838_08080 [Spirulinaceae cyanobacterium RM2_2_10]|nr:hypothetical protein [Spirulinaceae cyanobacterium SM2_1_0]NJO20012.1 hypothetical protein [Spirulinaceae cyanobacterium RM2_2_10]
MTTGLLLSCQAQPPADGNADAAPQIIELTQTGCQFLETESGDRGYAPTSAEDCEQINADTLAEREAEFEPLELAAGTYTFRVTNTDVPYELGFYLRGAGASTATLPKVSGGGLTEGTTQEYEITLKPGSYVFSCPLNPTPDYPVVVN